MRVGDKGVRECIKEEHTGRGGGGGEGDGKNKEQDRESV